MDDNSISQPKKSSKKKIILIISIAIILILGVVLATVIIQKNINSPENENTTKNENYLVVAEWNIKFTIPDTITDVRYKIVEDIHLEMDTVHGAIYFVAKPIDSDVQFVADLETKFTEYSARYLLRMSEATFAVDDIPKIGEYWFVPFTNRTELALARTGAIYGEMNDTNADFERTANNGISEMFRTIQTIKP